MNHMSTNEVIELLKKYVTLLNIEGISVYKASDESDIEVMIVSDNYD